MIKWKVKLKSETILTLKVESQVKVGDLQALEVESKVGKLKLEVKLESRKQLYPKSVTHDGHAR